MWFLEKYFDIKLKKHRIERHLNKIPAFKVITHPIKPLASAVQRVIRPVERVEDYIDMLHGFVREAAENGSSLVAFPEYNFLDLLGIIPVFKSMSRKFEAEGSRDMGELYSLFLSIADPVRSALETIMCGLAERYGIYIYTGSYFLREDTRLFNVGSLISREGRIIGTQKKLHLTSFERELGLMKGNILETFETDLGKIACPICMDGSYFETFKLIKNEGCNIAILPIANNEDYNIYRALRGAWLRAQESHMYIVKPSLNGSIAGLVFTGRAGIYAPLGCTQTGMGTVLNSRGYKGSQLITAELDLEALTRANENSEYYGDVNKDFEVNYFKKTYLNR